MPLVFGGMYYALTQATTTHSYHACTCFCTLCTRLCRLNDRPIAVQKVMRCGRMYQGAIKSPIIIYIFVTRHRQFCFVINSTFVFYIYFLLPHLYYICVLFNLLDCLALFLVGSCTNKCVNVF